MSWIKLNMKFPGTCIVCNEKININEPGLWQKGVGVKHEKCAEVKELKVCQVLLHKVENFERVQVLCKCKYSTGSESRFY